MSVGYAGTQTAGQVCINKNQAAANAATVPQAVLDDSVNGSTVLHLGGEGPAPTAAINAHAGTGGSPAATLDTYASDLCGLLTIKTGTASWAAGVQATVTFGTPHQQSTYVQIEPADDATAALMATLLPYAAAVDASGAASLAKWSVGFHAADSAQHTLNFFYQIGGF